MRSYIPVSSMRMKTMVVGSTSVTDVEVVMRDSVKAPRVISSPRISSLVTTPRIVWHWIPV